MKYIIKNDLSIFKHSIFYILLFYILPLTLFFIINNLMGAVITNKLIENYFSYNIQLYESNWFLIIMSLMSIIILLVIIYLSITNDIKNDKANIFLRISFKKWLIYKSISLSIIIILYCFIKFLFLLITLKNNFFLVDSLLIIVSQLFEYIFIANMFLIVYVFLGIWAFIIGIISMVFVFINIPIYLLILIGICSGVLVIIISKVRNIRFIERNE